MRLLGRRDYQPLKQRPLAHALNVPDKDYPAFVEALTSLREERQLVIGPGQRITLPRMTDRFTGTFESTSRGFGFVRPEQATREGDLFIPPGQSLDAISGDRVVAVVLSRAKEAGMARLHGRIVEVLERGQSEVVGTLIRQGRYWLVQPDGRDMTELVAVDDPSAKDAHEGHKVRVEIVKYPTATSRAQGVILEVLGKTGLPKAELLGILRRYNLPEKFSRSALRQARAAAQKFEALDDPQQPGREDIRSQTVITIDPTDARDFDDAISLRRLPKGHVLLGVHIADVATFVKPDSHLDNEARQRANSAYLPRHVVPMLPEVLSNSICSLQENQDRYVKSAYIRLDPQGNVVSTRFANSLIRSSRRFTYDQVDLILVGNTAGFPRPLVQLVRKMEALARVLQTRRLKDGMLTLDLPDPELVYDDKGRVIDARPESRTFSHTMIEMFMLEANEAAARLLDSLNVPFLRRIHPEPDALASGESARVLNICGYPVPKDINRKGLQQLLNRVAGKPESFIINLAVLKSMQRAEYSPAPMGHYALASRHYCHFTSPIRRYPDLTVHRLLQAYLTGWLTKKTARDFPDADQLAELGQHCNTMEQNATDAERELTRVKLLQLLANRIGEETKAVVTSVTNFGVFVRCERFLTEGLISADDIRRAFPQHNAGRRGRQRFIDTCPYRIGQQITVRIAAVNIPGRALDLVPADKPKTTTKTPKQPKKHPRKAKARPKSQKTQSPKKPRKPKRKKSRKPPRKR